MRNEFDPPKKEGTNGKFQMKVFCVKITALVQKKDEPTEIMAHSKPKMTDFFGMFIREGGVMGDGEISRLK